MVPVSLLTLLLSACRSQPPIIVECDTENEDSIEGEDTSTDGSIEPSNEPIVDADNDGYPSSTDCDDFNPQIHPNHPELCKDSIDSDCDGHPDSDLCTLTIEAAQVLQGTVSNAGFGRQVTHLPYSTTHPNTPLQDALAISANYDSGGVVYLFSENIHNSNIDAQAQTTLRMSNSSLFGTIVEGANSLRHSDVTGDGINDLIVTAPGTSNAIGQVHIYEGPLQFNETNRTPVQSLAWTSDFDAIRSIELIDWNQDAIMDVLIGHSRADNNGTDSGSIRVYLGREPTGLDQNSTGLLDLSTTLRLDGSNPSDLFGHSIRNLGDINDDGFDDLAISSYRSTASTGQFHAGKVSILMSPLSEVTSIEEALHLEGTVEHGYFGSSIERIGDMNGDGVADIAIGSIGYDQKGAVFILSGKTTDWCMDCSVLELAFATIIGSEINDNFGRNILNLDDINGDGFDDMLIGTKDASIESNKTGAAFLYFGPLTGTLNNQYHGRISGKTEQAQLSVDMERIDVDGDTIPDLVLSSRKDSEPVDEGRVYFFSSQLFQPNPLRAESAND